MRTFDIIILYKKKHLVYKNLTGEKALKLMKWLEPKFVPFALTEANNIKEILSTKEMETIYN